MLWGNPNGTNVLFGCRRVSLQLRWIATNFLATKHVAEICHLFKHIDMPYLFIISDACKVDLELSSGSDSADEGPQVAEAVLEGQQEVEATTTEPEHEPVDKVHRFQNV